MAKGGRGCWVQCLKGRETNAAGLELSFATNTLGAFALTRLLEPVLQRSAPARVVFMSSGGMYSGGWPTPNHPPTLYTSTHVPEGVCMHVDDCIHTAAFA